MRASETLRFGGLVYDPVRRVVVAANGAETVLRAKMLALLALRHAIWGAMNAPGENAAISRDSLPLSSRGFRMAERV